MCLRKSGANPMTRISNSDRNELVNDLLAIKYDSRLIFQTRDCKPAN